MNKKYRSNFPIQTLKAEKIHYEVQSRNNLRDFRDTEIKWFEGIARKAFDRKKKVYLVTLMYRQIPGALKFKLERMLGEAKWIEARLLHEVVRCPTSEIGKKKRPVIFGSPDCGKISGAPELNCYISVNDGWHFHLVIIIPRKSRLKTGLKKHFVLKEKAYLKPDKYLLRIHVKRVRTKPKRVARYAFKQGSRQDLRDYYLY
jgi:hypothetical protein